MPLPVCVSGYCTRSHYWADPSCRHVTCSSGATHVMQPRTITIKTTSNKKKQESRNEKTLGLIKLSARPQIPSHACTPHGCGFCFHNFLIKQSTKVRYARLVSTLYLYMMQQIEDWQCFRFIAVKLAGYTNSQYWIYVYIKYLFYFI